MKYLIFVLALTCGNLGLADGVDCKEDGKQYFTINTPESESSEKSLKFFYGTAFPFNKEKPIILVVPGGPGGLLKDVIEVVTDPEVKSYFENLGNIISFDHRGTGCSKKLNPGLPLIAPHIWSLSNASRDLEFLKQDLLVRFGLPASQKIIVVGFSYGGMLGLQYLVDYPNSTSRAVIGSTIYKASHFQLARDQYVDLMVNYSDKVKNLFESVLAKYPGSRDRILRAGFSFGYSNKKRTKGFPDFLNSLLNAESPEEFERIIYTTEDWYLKEEAETQLIPCSSVWDYPASQPANNYFLTGWLKRCAPFKSWSKPFDLTDQLKEIKIPVLLMAGGKDHITPAASVREMSSLIPQSLLWVNEESGHGVRTEKPLCFAYLLSMFVGAAETKQLKAVIDGPACQLAP